MPYNMKPLSCDPARIKGMSERLIVSHYENNYGGAVKRLNLIDEKLAELDYANAAGFVVNGLSKASLRLCCATRWSATSARTNAGAGNLSPWAKGSAAVQGGCCCLGHRVTESLSINGLRITATHWLAEHQFSRSICTSTPITSTLAQSLLPTLTLTWPPFDGRTRNDYSTRFKNCRQPGEKPT